MSRAVCDGLFRKSQVPLEVDLVEVPRLTYNSGDPEEPFDDYIEYSWWGKKGRTYFVQYSEDLVSWDYWPTIYSTETHPSAPQYQLFTDGFYRPTEFIGGNEYPAAQGFIRLRIAPVSVEYPGDADFDGDKISNYEEVTNGTDPLHYADSDNDGLPDDWETLRDLDPHDGTDADDDSDGDGLTNTQEYQYNTGPNETDTDFDGAADGWEISKGFDPLSASDGYDDTDEDTLLNRDEYRLGFNPRSSDSDDDGVLDIHEDRDSDGMPDCWELAIYDSPTAAVANGHDDADTLTNLQEYQNGTNPFSFDTDYDELPDDWEVTYQFDPVVQDNRTGDPDGDGIQNLTEYRAGFSPRSTDTDNDSIPDTLEDRDLDGLRDLWELEHFDSPTLALPGEDHDLDSLNNLQEQALGTLPKQPDTDDDGMNDGWEQTYGMNPLVDNTTLPNPAIQPNADPDADGLINLEEEQLNTNPFEPDTDGDGYGDLTEEQSGASATSSTSTPTAPGGPGTSPSPIVKVQVTFGDHSGSHSEKYRVILEPLEGDPNTAKRYRSNQQYGVLRTDIFYLPKGAKYKVTLVHLASKERGGPDYDYTLELQGDLSTTPTPYIKVDDPNGMMGIHDESNPFFASGKSAVLYVPKIEWVTPAKSPVTEPKDSGDGQNEFTYDASSPGVVSINLKALIHPTGAAAVIKGDAAFDVDAISGSTKAWASGNPSGSPTVSGEHLLATVSFTTLPSDNAAFGTKNARLLLLTVPQSATQYEVFFSKTETNHPGTGPYTAARPQNWFYYWQQGSVCGIPSDAVFEARPQYGRVLTGESFIRLGMEAPMTNSGPETFVSPTYGSVTVTGTGKGIECVAETVVHEKHHLTLRTVLGSRTDSDGDGIADADEATLDGVASSSTDPNSYSLPEYAARGDNEIRCRKKELSHGVTLFPSKDWANPGCQSKSQFGPTP